VSKWDVSSGERALRRRPHETCFSVLTNMLHKVQHVCQQATISSARPAAQRAGCPGRGLVWEPTAYLVSITGVTRSLTRKDISPLAGWYHSNRCGKDAALRATSFPQRLELDYLYSMHVISEQRKSRQTRDKTSYLTGRTRSIWVSLLIRCFLEIGSVRTRGGASQVFTHRRMHTLGMRPAVSKLTEPVRLEGLQCIQRIPYRIRRLLQEHFLIIIE
jgi:hypothetical protein